MPRDTTPPDIGQRLTAARLRRGLTQRIVARRAGVAASYLSRVETGRIQPTFRTVSRLLRAMKADLEELMDSSDGESKDGACPLTVRGACLLDLLHADRSESATDEERYTPREIRLLRKLAAWVRAASPDRLRAMEVLLEDLMAVSSSTERR
ncbi:MAG: helix-turn-helix transcriptional regulator [Planctomycetes bacterium]|nr:helix-turn-helix transcriptional regulator [Planctomycetota bacterium]